MQVSAKLPQRSRDAADLARRIAAGDRAAAAHAISLIESEAPEALALLKALYPHVGRAYRVGLTGPPGAGKSTLADKLALELRARGASVGIVAVDPTSPFSGGAILGDRIRMQAATADPGVFMRSMATRGSLGGLAKTTQEAADVLDAFGKDWILIETVGVGQSELDVAQAVDTTVVVLVPESGSGIQAMKAGLMEIGHCFAVNKADRPGADDLERDVADALHMASSPDGWLPPVVQTVGLDGRGVAELLAKVEAHRAHLEHEGLLPAHRRAQGRAKIKSLVAAYLETNWWKDPAHVRRLDRLAEAVAEGKKDPFTAAREFLAAVGVEAQSNQRGRL